MSKFGQSKNSKGQFVVCLLVALCVIGGVVGGKEALAQNAFWTGNAGNPQWSLTNNWTPGPAPTSLFYVSAFPYLYPNDPDPLLTRLLVHADVRIHTRTTFSAAHVQVGHHSYPGILTLAAGPGGQYNFDHGDVDIAGGLLVIDGSPVSVRNLSVGTMASEATLDLDYSSLTTSSTGGTYVGSGTATAKGTINFNSGTWNVNERPIYVGGSASAAVGEGRINVGPDASFIELGLVKVWERGTFHLADGNVTLGTFNLEGGSITGFGSLHAPISGYGTIAVESGRTLTLGNADGGAEFSFTGNIEVGVGELVLLQPDAVELPSTTLSEGTLAARNGIELDGTSTITGTGLIIGTISGTNAQNGLVAEGSLHRTTSLDVGDDTVRVLSQHFANLGPNTTITGGTAQAPSGIALGVGNNLIGHGAVEGRIAAAFGSTIDATGNLSLGDANAFDGFFSDGVLYTNQHEVTIHDRNVAVLGSLTALGNGTAGGVLTAGNAQPSDNYSHFLVAQGKNIVGRGEINGHFKNHGDAVGDGPGAGERLVFNSPWTVSGKGTFTNTMVLGTFAPGDSPAIITGHNQGFGGMIEIELGGLTPGFGDDNHDQINDTGTILLQDEPELAILPWNDFVPDMGDQFVVMTWAEGLTGTFGSVTIDPWFVSHGILFSTTYVNPTGAGSLILTAAPVPEPGTALLLLFGAWIALPFRRRGRR